MKTMTIREIRQRWPEAERQLGLEKEIIITRDGKPVARLLPVEETPVVRKRLDFEAHRQWQKEVFGDVVLDDSTVQLMRDREERSFL